MTYKYYILKASLTQCVLRRALKVFVSSTSRALKVFVSSISRSFLLDVSLWLFQCSQWTTMLITSSHRRLVVFKMVFRHICVNSFVCNNFCVNTDQTAKSVVNVWGVSAPPPPPPPRRDDTGVSEDFHQTGWLK